LRPACYGPARNKGTIRASLAFYNTHEEIDRLCEAIMKVKQMLNNKLEKMTINEIQEIVEEFEDFEEWLDKYNYLMRLANLFPLLMRNIRRRNSL
jgi:DNA-binding transcriptional regulator GbsR (MarR family)